MRIVITMRLNEVKAIDKLRPLLQCKLVDKVTLIRHDAINLKSDKLVQLNYASAAGFKSIWKTLYSTALNFWYALRVASGEKPDAILGYYLTPYGMIAWAVARLTGSLAMMSLIGTDFNKRLKTPVLGGLLLAILRNSDAVMVFGETARQELLNKGLQPSKVFALPNTANLTIYYPDPLIHPDYDLVYVGNLLPGKRVDLILRSLKKIREHRPQTNLLIVGDGVERPYLEKLAQSLSIADAVEFYGHSTSVVDQLRRARAFIFLSDHEGLPMALVEAMCTGLPAVATAVGAISTVITEGKNGFLVDPPADPDKVAAYLLGLLNDPLQYASFQKAALQVRNTHSYERSTQVWSEILASVQRSSRTRH